MRSTWTLTDPLLVSQEGMLLYRMSTAPVAAGGADPSRAIDFRALESWKTTPLRAVFTPGLLLVRAPVWSASVLYTHHWPMGWSALAVTSQPTVSYSDGVWPTMPQFAL